MKATCLPAQKRSRRAVTLRSRVYFGRAGTRDRWRHQDASPASPVGLSPVTMLTPGSSQFSSRSLQRQRSQRRELRRQAPPCCPWRAGAITRPTSAMGDSRVICPTTPHGVPWGTWWACAQRHGDKWRATSGMSMSRLSRISLPLSWSRHGGAAGVLLRSAPTRRMARLGRERLPFWQSSARGPGGVDIGRDPGQPRPISRPWKDQRFEVSTFRLPPCAVNEMSKQRP